MADDSALVLVGPDDTIDTVIQKVRDAGTRSVELLVAEGAPALQVIGGLARLRSIAADQNISLLLITSDEKTLNAARLNQIDTVGIQGTSVVAAPKVAEPINPYSTRPLPVVDLGSDDDVLRVLDDDTRPGRPSSAENSSSDDDILAALDDLSDYPTGAFEQPQAGRNRQTPVFNDRDERYAAELDDWGDLSSGDTAFGAVDPRQQDAGIPLDERPTRRVRPEDIDLTDDDLRRNDRRERARERDRERQAATRRATASTAAGVGLPRRSRMAVDDEGYEAAPRRSGNPLLIWVPVLLILLLLGAGAYWLYSNRATVVVRAPIPVTEEIPFQDLVIPLSREPVDEQSPAVQAIDVRGPAEYSAQGSVTSETVVPREFARGVVTVRNSGSTSLELPQGTEFIATNAQGQEVRFVTDAPVSVPPSTTSDTGAQIITQRGEAQVNVTARQPGSASNVDANTISQIAFSGQAPVGALIEHGPLTGGSEQPVRVVTEQEVQAVLQQALTGLYDQGQRMLQEQASAAGGSWSLEPSTISPTPAELSIVGVGQVFELIISPEVGQEVPVDNPAFTVTVRTTFNALAVPADKPLPQQLQTAVPRQLEISEIWKPGLAPVVNDDWRWDGSRLLVSGVLQPEETEATIDANTRAMMLDELRGKSRADAIALLEEYKRQGIISDYVLPDRDQLPSLSFQLDLRVE